MCVLVYGFVHMCAGWSPRRTWAVFITLHHVSLRLGLSLHLELDQQVPAILLSQSLSQLWGCRDMGPHLDFYVGFGDLNSGPHACVARAVTC